MNRSKLDDLRERRINSILKKNIPGSTVTLLSNKPEAHNPKWSAEDRALIDWFLNYLSKLPVTAEASKNELYINLKVFIAEGAMGPNAALLIERIKQIKYVLSLPPRQ